MNKKRILIALLCLLCFVLGGAAGVLLTKRASDDAAEARVSAYTEQNTFAHSLLYGRLTDGWLGTLQDTQADVVFFGDSLTAGGDWQTVYPYLYTCNLGVVGDVTEGLIARLPLVKAVAPLKCFVMIGINDLTFGRPNEQIINQYEELLDGLCALREENGTVLYVQSVLPVRWGEGLAFAQSPVQRIKALNESIKQACEARGITYIALFDAFADETGALKQEYSFDGVHLTELAYERWYAELQPYVDE